MKQAIFDNIKADINKGLLPPDVIMEWHNISQSTYSRVKRSDDYTAYRQLLKDNNPNNRYKNPKPRVGVVTKELFDKVKQSQVEGKSKKAIMAWYGISEATAMRILNQAETWEDWEALKKQLNPARTNTSKPTSEVKTTPLSHEDVALILKEMRSLSAQFADLKNSIDEQAKTYAWVVEHAQIDTAKKRSRFF